MSSAGQIVGGVIGAVVGAFIPGSYVWMGAQVGMMLGGMLDPPKGPTVVGPRIDDLTVQTSTYGAPIPRVYGTIPVVGNVFWLENNRITEVVKKKKSGGKGGGSKTTTKTFSYFATFAVGLADTKSLGAPIVGIRRIWIGPDLWYDAGSNDTDTIAASNAAAEGFELYLGSDTQSPDPRISAALGVNASAYRGVAYIVFYDLPLARYGNSLAGAQIKVEIMQQGATYTYPYTNTTMPVSRSWQLPAYDGSWFCAPSYFTKHVIISPDGINWTQVATPGFDVDSMLGCASNGSGTLLIYGARGVQRSTDHGQTWTAIASYYAGYTTAIAWNGSYFLAITDSGDFFTSATGEGWAPQTPPGGYGNYSYSLVWNGSVFSVVTGFGATPKIYTSPTGYTGTWTLQYTTPATYSNITVGVSANGTIVYEGQGDILGVVQALTLHSLDNGVTWSPYPSPAAFDSLSFNGNVVMASTNANYYISEDFGVTWITHAIALGGASKFLACAGNGSFIGVTHGSTLGAFIRPLMVSPGTEALANVVKYECLQSGLITAADIETVTLTQQVRGYRIGSIGAIRASIEPLQGVWPFDVVQHGYKIQFKARGTGSVATIRQDDLDARTASSEPGVLITTARESDVQLPSNVTIKYLDYGREYDVGEQYAERLTVQSANLRVIDVPISLTDSEAAAVSEVLLYLYWLERNDVSFNLPPTYNQLEPADVVTLETPEGNISLRLIGVNNTSDGIVECQARYNLDAVYVSTAPGATPAVTGVTLISRIGASYYTLLDVPYVHSTLADPAFLCAMYGQYPASWTAGVLYRTDDGGTTWNDLQGFVAPGAVVGNASSTIGVVDNRVWDKASSLSVSILNGTLSSVTELAVLNGANYFAYGVHGRWEIIGVQICTLVSGTQYTCRDMLRGRFGTEWAMGLHQVGDKFVLLDANYVTAIGMNAATIGLSRAYRGITESADISSDTDYNFTYNGVNLECLAPAHFKANIPAGGTDWLIEWVRRSRTDGEWRDLVDAGLGETSEAYEVDIYSDNTYTVIKRTIQSAVQSCTYFSADQVADFGSDQTVLYAKVYQMSSVVGRGYPTTGAFPL